MKKIDRAMNLAALALLGACEARIGKSEAEKAEAGAASQAPAAAGKAEEGQLSIKAPGFDLKLDIPDAIANHANADGELIYPGAELSGMHVEAGADKGAGRQSGVELRFRSTDPVDKVAAWYRDPARAEGFAIASTRREESGLVIEGTQKSDGDPFTLRLTPAPTGTAGRLTLSDRN